ncbi:ATP-binding protein [bacterium]|jgi:anti-sigma regulatory factor (Ser/Thr protein kinase)|nr:ATP-binding protein [Bacteroidota bacterium]MBT6143344.1 ATP-binding protein [bacterium]
MEKIVGTLQKDNNPVEIKIELPTNAYFMSGIRDFTLSLIENMTDFSSQWAYRFQSVVDELANNAIEHGSKANDKILVTFYTVADKEIRITVEDHGNPQKPITAAEIMKILETNKNKDKKEFSIRGRGLAFIIDKWTDELIVEDRPNGGLKFTVVKHLKDDSFKTLEQSDDPKNIVI